MGNENCKTQLGKCKMGNGTWRIRNANCKLLIENKEMLYGILEMQTLKCKHESAG